MAVVSVSIPQIGEGLQEARLVAVLKQPGDRVRRDEPIYQMETDKAVMDVESPFDGILVEWLAPVDTILAIGAEVARMEVATVADTMDQPPIESPQSIALNGHVAPSNETTGSETSNIVSVAIPQIGEGLQEARLVATLKQPGDSIKRDEAIYQMETDKAVMDVESPYEGILLEWLASVDTVLAIGAPVAKIQVAAGTATNATPTHGPVPTVATANATPQTASPSQSAGGPLRNAQISPKVRAAAIAQGVSEAQLNQLAQQFGKVTLQNLSSSPGPTIPAQAVSGAGVGGTFQENPVPPKQRLLASRLVRGTQLVVPGTIVVVTNWEAIENLRAKLKSGGGDFQPSAFTMFAFAVALAMRDFPMFRSTLRGDELLRTYDHATLGIAVALPGDELVLAVVEEADKLGWKEFAAVTREQIDLARSGKDQANESVTLSLTNMQAFGLRDAVPVVVPPAVGTLFLGEPFYGQDPESPDPKVKRYVNLSLTFDHRLINGVGAAEFINRVKSNVEQIETVLQAQ